MWGKKYINFFSKIVNVLTKIGELFSNLKNMKTNIWLMQIISYIQFNILIKIIIIYFLFVYSKYNYSNIMVDKK